MLYVSVLGANAIEGVGGAIGATEVYGFWDPRVVKSGAHGGWPLTENWRNFRKLIVNLIIEALSKKSDRLHEVNCWWNMAAIWEDMD